MVDRPRPLPRMTRVNYPPRVFGFGATFIAVAWLVFDRGWSYWNLPFFALFLLVYPHLIVLADKWRRATQSIESKAMMLDALLLGVLTTHIQFSGWISYTLLAAVSLNNTMVGGVPQFRNAILWYLAGVLGWGLVVGFHWQPSAPLGIEILSMASLQIYIFSTAWVFSTQNHRLVRIKRDVEDKNQLFHSLLELTALTDRSGSLEQLVPGALKQFKRLYPDVSFGFVLRDAVRHEVVSFAHFTDEIPPARQTTLLRYITGRPFLPQGQYIEPGDYATGCYAFPLLSRLEHSQGIVLACCNHLDDAQRETLQLLLDQLNTSLANTLLTQALKNAAERDSLTGIFNRGRLDSELESAVATHERNPSLHFSVVLIDLIGLKWVNDEYGHTAGDQLICAAAKALGKVCRESDGLFRFGGDEFVILCLNSTLVGMEALKRRIETSIQNTRVEIETETEGRKNIPIRLSLGFASTCETSPNQVLKLADERMYADKERWYRDHERYR